MEHNAYIIKPEQGLISSLLKLFAMFDFRLIYDRDKVGDIAIRCTSCKKERCLYLGNSTLEEMINKFVLNVIMHHVGMSWIICSNEEMKYEIDEINNQDWLNKYPWYNTAICSSLHESLFGDFITHARTNRYKIMCSLVAHDKKQPYPEDEESSIVDSLIHKHVTTESLEALGATLNFINIWLKMLD